MFDEVTNISLLYDFYGNLLSERQREIVGLRYEDDLSLAEIAGELGISRQGVYDALKNGERSLNEYEQRLGLVKRFAEETEAVEKIDEELSQIMADHADDQPLVKRLKDIKDIIDGMDL